MEKRIYLIILVMLVSGCATLDALFTPQVSGTIIQDEKYGNISDKYFVYISPNTNLTKRAKVNLSKIFSSYQKTIKYDKILVEKSQSNQFSPNELKNWQDEKMKEIFKDIENTISDFAKKNLYKAIYTDKMPHCKEEDASVEIIKILNAK